ncbi:SAM-dependent RNA methyltransferase [Plasmodium gonderi]|uniref:SAM-dependent RNA methyltransferase n=1 Tax=Plasmodium gonderi TaxID=77519 RepID=A0A1Y1JPB3_PLAGO|nr:SAM-dependent RNA methyltransferase [Plasmodium gonderi]GAW82243.1 SAM-dependent RNA methyltransferase [Plasmodium gonderi]
MHNEASEGQGWIAPGPKYIVEHLDELEEWCILEYVHICETVKDENVIFTKFDKEFSTISKEHKPTCYQQPINQLREKFGWKRICLLDMKAKDVLTCDDKKNLDFLLFGGILGNVPSDDRTSILRKCQFTLSRNLGDMQMTTNTAVLVCHIILNNNVELDAIPFVDNPEIPLRNKKESMVLPFRFVSKYFFTKLEQDRHVPVLPRNFTEYLIRLGDQRLTDLDDFLSAP